MAKSKDDKRFEVIKRLVAKYGSTDYHLWPFEKRIEARRIYMNCDTHTRAKIADLVELKYQTGFILFLDRQ